MVMKRDEDVKTGARGKSGQRAPGWRLRSRCRTEMAWRVGPHDGRACVHRESEFLGISHTMSQCVSRSVFSGTEGIECQSRL